MSRLRVVCPGVTVIFLATKILEDLGMGERMNNLFTSEVDVELSVFVSSKLKESQIHNFASTALVNVAKAFISEMCVDSRLMMKLPCSHLSPLSPCAILL